MVWYEPAIVMAGIFTRGSPKSRIQYDPTCFLARFAVDQYNKKENANLKFVKGVDLKQYIVAGKLYHVTLKAWDGMTLNVYKAEIRKRLYEQKGFLLTEFKRGCDAPSGKFPKFKRSLSSIFLNLRVMAATASISVGRFFQVEQSGEDLTTSTVAKKLNPIDPPTTDNLARFAVDQHNIKKKKHSKLKFVKGIDSKQYLTFGNFYDVTLEAMDGEKVKVYQAAIWERPRLNFQQLSEFKLVGKAPLLI